VGAPNPDVRTEVPVGDRPPRALILGGFLVMVMVLTAVASIAAKPAKFTGITTGPVWLDAWFQLDSGWYYSIAVNGYYFDPGGESSVAFFPTYPMMVRGLGSLIGGDYQVAGTLLSVLAGASAITLFATWVWQRLPRRGAATAVALMMVYPYAFYLYGAMYSDSVFLLTVIAAFLLLERRMYWTAGLVGALATAGRPVGVAITIGLMLRMLEMQVESRLSVGAAGRPSFRRIIGAVPTVRWRQAGVLVSMTGLVGWCVYAWAEFGNPLVWIQAQAGWNQASGPRTWFKVTYVDTLLRGHPLKALSITAQLVMCVIAVVLLPRVRRSFGWGYCAYAIVVLAIPLIGTKDFYGTGRYVLVAFPVVAVAGLLLAESDHRWLRPTVLIVFCAGLLGATTLYALGLPVS